MVITEFDWDEGNWPKCGKHGVSREEIEQVLLGTPAVMPDPHMQEPRLRAIGKTNAGRYVFFGFSAASKPSQSQTAPHQRPLYAQKGDRPL